MSNDELYLDLLQLAPHQRHWLECETGEHGREAIRGYEYAFTNADKMHQTRWQRPPAVEALMLALNQHAATTELVHRIVYIAGDMHESNDVIDLDKRMQQDNMLRLIANVDGAFLKLRQECIALLDATEVRALDATVEGGFVEASHTKRRLATQNPRLTRAAFEADTTPVNAHVPKISAAFRELIRASRAFYAATGEICTTLDMQKMTEWVIIGGEHQRQQDYLMRALQGVIDHARLPDKSLQADRPIPAPTTGQSKIVTAGTNVTRLSDWKATHQGLPG